MTETETEREEIKAHYSFVLQSSCRCCFFFSFSLSIKKRTHWGMLHVVYKKRRIFLFCLRLIIIITMLSFLRRISETFSFSLYYYFQLKYNIIYMLYTTSLLFPLVRKKLQREISLVKNITELKYY